MKNYRILTVAVLIFAMLFTLCACKAEPDTVPEGTYLLKNAKSVKHGEPAAALNAQSVYDSLTYIPEMFYGTYVMANDEQTLTAYTEDSDYMTVAGGTYTKLTAIPCGIHAARSKTAADTGIYPMTLTFRTEDGLPVTKDCAFSIDGKKLVCRLVKSFSYDDGNNIKDAFYSDTVLEYGFAFSGTKLTLTAGEKSIELVSEMFAKDPPSFYLNCYNSADHETLESIRHMEFSWSGTASTRLSITDTKNNTYPTAAATLSRDGLFTLTLPDSTAQYVFFYASSDSLVLTDGTNIYTFNSDWFDEYKKGLADNLTPEEAEKLKDLSQEEIEALIAKKSQLIDDIVKAFSDVGISINVNRATGEVSMDSSVLFGGDSSEISENGKELLNKVVKAYTEVIFNDNYKDFISGITVAGHTAPTKDSDYTDDLPLSQQRADNVRNYCISAETGLDAETLKKLSGAMTAVGRSNSDPVKDKNGNVDIAASRRVTFHLAINVSQPATN